ncbi:MATE family efflux transporter [Companilactobacillus nodensis]|uniref:Multidrug export protein MepA n=1 Tax=Companilactobacillus nodensis DSM 19682 = JCM 14932 = NBRC 107160 TaxID=1423775 RepID=A0A0R1KHK7_9LACO|nr:MATE family efflux transporter [Companilactobacillus nodensis]KRK80409.1 Na+-driven multidrug efflux pump [Companilactobacillus nodensis DSM 19682 = JCM 14932 = NBRC 107160]
MNELFEKESIPKAYFTLALPVVLGMVASMIYNLADTFFIAQTQNTDLVAGVALCTPLFSFLLALGDIFGLGGSSLISRLLGQTEHEKSRRVSSFCFYWGIILGVITAILLIAFENPILHMLGANNSTYHFAASFYHIMALGAPVIIVSLVPSNLIRTEGFAKQSMIGTIIGTIVTIILDPILIFPMNMGAAGAALATVIGYGVTDIMLIWATLKYCNVISVDIHKMSINKKLITQVIIIGIPASITNLMQAFGTAVINRYLESYGAVQIAAMGIVLKVYMIIMLIMVGFAFGAQPLIGYNFGAKNFDRFKKIIRFDLLVEMVYALVLAVILMIFAPQIVGLFLKNTAVITAGTHILRAFLCTTPFVGAILVFTTVFQSTGKALDAFIMSIARQGIIFYLVIVLASRIFGYYGVVWSQPLADLITFLIGLFLYKETFKLTR